MNLAPQYIHVVGPQRHSLAPTKATVGEELDQLCTTSHSLINRIGQVSHMLGCQMSLIPFACLWYLHRVCRIPPDETVVDSLGQHRRHNTFCLTHPRRRQAVRGHRGNRRVGNPAGTGFASTSPLATRNAYIDDNDDNRRLIVRADNPDSPSTSRITFGSPADRCAVMNANTSAVVTPTGSFPTTVKKIFKSDPAAITVFGRHRAARNSR